MPEPAQSGWATTKLGQSLAGRRVLITGHTGFKGAWLCLWLLEMGAQVIGVSDRCTPGAHFHQLGIARELEDLRCDVCDGEGLRLAMQDAGAELAIHMAAQALVGRGSQYPLETFQTNTMGTVNFLEALRHCPETRAAIVVTSDKVYARHEEESRPHLEQDSLGGEEPYSASKACAELVFQAYRDHFFRHDGPLIASARAGNVIGGGDHNLDRLVPDCARHWLDGASLMLRTPRAVRPWQHVLDALSGYLVLGSALLGGDRALHGQAFNIGPSETCTTTVEELVSRLAETWPKHPEPPFTVRSGSTEDLRAWERCLQVNPEKAERLLGWRGLLNLSESIAMSAAWYRDAHSLLESGSLEGLRARSRADLSVYLERALASGASWI